MASKPINILEPVLISAILKKTYYKQFSTNIKIKIIKLIPTSFASQDLVLGANKSGFNLIIFHLEEWYF